MNGSVTINGTRYPVTLADLTPADVLPVFRTDTSILKTDSILLHAAGAEQNSAKKVLLPHLISMLSSSVAEEVVLTIEPYYDENGVYQGMCWHYNSGWLRRNDTGDMIRVDDTAAEIALAADQAVRATEAAKTAAAGAIAADNRATNNESARVTAENNRRNNETERQQQETARQQAEQTRQSQEQTREQQAAADHSTALADHSTAGTDHTRAEQDHSTAATDHTTADADHARAETDHNRAGQDHSTALSDHSTADADHAQAEQDHSDALEATAGAEKVNATLVGMTVTVTDRNGQSRSRNIGFEITEDHVYPSVAAMQADAANVLPGKFCMVATTDKTSEENARLYTKNSADGFTFLSDLDQAATHAFADWMENYKPVIEADHSRAESDHSTAVSDTGRAATDHQTATQDHENYTADRQTFADNEAARQQTFDTNEAQRQEDFENAEADRMAAMTVTRCFVDLTTMCLMFVQPASDSTQYQVRNGDLNITVRYEV